jgi:uncharacterized membrane protein YtjA (UPF0391 family)
LGLGVVCLVIALIAALFGFGIASTESFFAAKIFFFIFLVLAVLSFVGGGYTYYRRGSWES